ncbi:MAG: ParB N-terminal domain-containing protein [Ruminococcus sp.]|nr:ParB N-terminal domain-containing protein [Ruminococcus sp.]MBP1537762.1 ParB N-terminal domain-containing protein [Ruminococcus sp.]
MVKINLDDTINRAREAAEEIQASVNKTERTEFILVSDIVENKDNVFRVADMEETAKEDFDELVANIKENGLLHNIVVYQEGNKYILLSGERRVRAFKALGKDKIKATIVPPGSWFENFNKLLSANTETRKYTPEARDRIITAIKEKIKERVSAGDVEGEIGNKIVTLVSKFFGVSERMAYKYLDIAEDLIQPLKDLHYQDIISTISAASFAGLPTKAQEKIVEMYENDVDSAQEDAQSYAKEVRSIIEKDKQALKKIKWQKDYLEKRHSDAMTAGNISESAKYEDKLKDIAEKEKKFLKEQEKEFDNIVIPKKQPKVAPTAEQIVSDSKDKIRKLLDKIVAEIGDKETIDKIKEMLEEI